MGLINQRQSFGQITLLKLIVKIHESLKFLLILSEDLCTKDWSPDKIGFPPLFATTCTFSAIRFYCFSIFGQIDIAFQCLAVKQSNVNVKC